MKTKIIIFLMATLLWSCNKPQEAITNETQISEESYTYSNEQLNEANVKIGSPIKKEYFKKIVATGKVLASPNGKSDVYSLANGFVHEIFKFNGDEVKKGDVLLTIKSLAALDLQNQFYDSKVELHNAQISFKRLQKLSENNITSKKEFENVEGRLKNAEAKFTSLEHKIKALKINREKVLKGEFSPIIKIKAPIAGTINQLEIYLGQKIEESDLISSIINPSKKILSFNIFEKDIPKVKVNQKVVLHRISDPELKFTTNIKSIGNELNESTNSLRCLAELNETTNQIQINSTVKVEIHVDEMQSWALPINSLVNKTNVLKMVKATSNQKSFKTIPIKIEHSDESYVYIIDSTLQNIVLNGAYQLTPDE